MQSCNAVRSYLVSPCLNLILMFSSKILKGGNFIFPPPFASFLLLRAEMLRCLSKKATVWRSAFPLLFHQGETFFFFCFLSVKHPFGGPLVLPPPMDLIENCTLVFDIDAIVLHTDPRYNGSVPFSRPRGPFRPFKCRNIYTYRLY